MANNMINVTPLIPGHEAEIADDLKKMYRDGVIASAAWCLALVPEGQPVIDKASRLAELVTAHQAHLAGSGIPLGILLQATMGHGWTPSEPAAFQRFTIADGRERYIFCPLDQDFLNYVGDAVRKLARLKPEFFMLDDDTRMFTGRGGCYCPLQKTITGNDEIVNRKSSNRKLIIDGQLFIIRDGKTYNATGAEVR